MIPTLQVVNNFSQPVDGQKTLCLVCPHGCCLSEGQAGWCRARVARSGVVEPISGQSYIAHGIGVVEEHPLFHFYPGLRSLSLGAMGCSAECRYCQNWELALAPRFPNLMVPASPFATQNAILKYAHTRDCGGISFTYHEPTIWLEGLLPLAAEARAEGLKVILVTNGYITPEVLTTILPHIDAVKLDLKAHNEASYQQLTAIRLGPVLNTLRTLVEHGIWCEVSTVIIPHFLTIPTFVAEIVTLLEQSSALNLPWHLLRFFPAYRMITDSAPEIVALRQLRQQAFIEGLRYVYISNIPNIEERNTYCPRCDQVIATRLNTTTTIPLPVTCPYCQLAMDGMGLIKGSHS